MSELANYHFIPSLRQGLAAALQEDATGARATVHVTLRAMGEKFGGGTSTDEIVKPVQLFGPGDVRGFEPRIVTRTDPRANVGDFEPNYFPAVEFADPDFVWRFTAGAADENGNLLPWITLIALVAEDVPDETQPDRTKKKEFTEGDRGETDSVPWISVSTEFLPDLAEAWRWSHVQVTAGANLDVEELRGVLRDHPERAVSRLLCPRRLRPDTRYRAFVVPTFRLGAVAAGLEAPPESPSAMELAWEKSGSVTTMKLPYYYDWEFGTGWRGDFEHLLRLLEPRELTGLGVRDMDCSRPGFGLPGTDGRDVAPERRHVLRLEGALKSLDTEFTPWGRDDPEGEAGGEFRTQLGSELLNEPFTILTRQAEATSGDVRDLRIVPVVPPGDEGMMLIEWTTEIPSTSRIQYGETHEYGHVAEEDEAGLVTRHAVTVGGLEPAKVYHFRVDSEDGEGNPVTTEDIEFVPLPSVVPPIYGRWHAGRARVDDTGASDAWIDVLNLDPRHRAGAGFGARVVQDQQEPLMAEAWRQLGAIEEANEALRRAQLGRAASRGLFQRVEALVRPETATDYRRETFLRLMRPVHGRVRAKMSDAADAPVATMRQHLRAIGPAPLDPAFQRITRPHGPIRKRQRAVPAELQGKLLDRLNKEKLAAISFVAEPKGTVGFSHVMQAIAPEEVVDPPPADTNPGPTPGSDPGPAPDLNPAPVLESSVYEVQLTEIALGTEGVFTDAEALDIAIGDLELPPQLRAEGIQAGIAPVLQEWLKVAPAPEPPPGVDLAKAGQILKDAMNPEVTLVARIGARLRLDGLPLDAIERRGDPLDRIMAAPEFPQPMYESLRDRSQDMLLPGIEKVPQNTVGLLEANRRFIESYLCGCNHEFAAELLWREYPTDQRGSYFRQFWDVEGFVPNPDQLELWTEEAENQVSEDAEDWDQLVQETLHKLVAEDLKDIRPLHRWRGAPLGGNENSRDPDLNLEEGLVLIVRGDLLKKYPNTVIYAVSARTVGEGRAPDLPEFIANGAVESEPIFPLFTGTLPPDTTFFGFSFDEDAARGSDDEPGMYFVLEERVSEARFGMDVPLGEGADIPSTVWEGMEDEPNLTDWDDLNWGLMEPDAYIDARNPKDDLIEQPKWDVSSATIAWITLQKPVRICIHASQMLPQPQVGDDSGE